MKSFLLAPIVALCSCSNPTSDPQKFLEKKGWNDVRQVERRNWDNDCDHNEIGYLMDGMLKGNNVKEKVCCDYQKRYCL